MPSPKCTEELKLRLPEDLYLELSRRAADEDRPLSDYVRFVLSVHIYGAGSHGRKIRAGGRDDE